MSLHEGMTRNGLVRPIDDRVLGGGCAGLGRRFGLEPWPAPSPTLRALVSAGCVGRPCRVWRRGAPADGWHAGGMRLFVAVTPPANVLEHLEAALASVRGGQGSGLRWTLPEARHITVAFYGEVPDGYLDDVVGGLDDVAPAHRSFEAALRGAGLFDGRTLWVGCSGEGWGPLMSAAGRIGTDLLGRAGDRRGRAGPCRSGPRPTSADPTHRPSNRPTGSARRTARRHAAPPRTTGARARRRPGRRRRRPGSHRVPRRRRPG